jgi:ATP-dependent Lon protease
MKGLLGIITAFIGIVGDEIKALRDRRQAAKEQAAKKKAEKERKKKIEQARKAKAAEKALHEAVNKDVENKLDYWIKEARYRRKLRAMKAEIDENPYEETEGNNDDK